MSSDARLIEAQKDFVRLRVDVSQNNRINLRNAIGAPARGAPYVAFFDREGQLLRDVSILGYDPGRVLAGLARARGS